MNSMKIKFKGRKSTFVSGVITVTAAVLFELFVLLLYMFGQKETEDVLVLVIMSVIFGITVLAGITRIRKYQKDTKELNNALRKYGERNVIQNINNATIDVYNQPASNTKTYFTSKLVVDPNQAIIDYREISMIYKHVDSFRYGKISSIAFALLNGNTYYLCRYVEDERIAEIMRICLQKNPKILFGYTKENQLAHKRNVERYKCGMTLLPKLSFESEEENNTESKVFISKERAEQILPTPKEWTSNGKKYGQGKRMSGIGGIILVISLIFVVLFPTMMNQEIDRLTNVVSNEKREEMLNVGCKEYKTVGRHLDKKFRNFKDLYIFKLENETELYLGVLSNGNWYTYNSEVGAGLHIFYDGDVSMDTIIMNEEECNLIVIEEEDIRAIYGIPSADNATNKMLNVVMSVAIFIPLITGGFIMIFVGRNMMKKYKI